MHYFDLKMSSDWITTVLIIVVIVMKTVTCTGISAGNQRTLTETDLHWKLFSNYNTNVMPRPNDTHVVDIGLEMNLLSVDNIDEKKQTISIRAFLELTWNDWKLQWNPRDYSNVTLINVHVERIWRPDIALRNTFHRPTDIGQNDGNANINQGGNVTTWPYKVYKVACGIDVSMFPFDEQTCVFQFVSWTNPSTVLRLRSHELAIRFASYAKSGEWDLLESKVENGIHHVDNISWYIVQFEFKLHRKPLFYVMNILIPVLSISVLNIICFALPSKGGERVTLSISVFLTFAVFLTMVNEVMPESSDKVSGLGVFITLQLFGSAVTVLMTTVSLYLFYTDSRIGTLAPCARLVKQCGIDYLSEDDDNTADLTAVESFPATTHINNTVAVSTDYEESVRGDTLQEEQINETVPDQKLGNEISSVEFPSKNVSIAIDRVCIVFAILWNVALLCIYIALVFL